MTVMHEYHESNSVLVIQANNQLDEWHITSCGSNINSFVDRPEPLPIWKELLGVTPCAYVIKAFKNWTGKTELSAKLKDLVKKFKSVGDLRE
jgi:hypothetical protein